jgi:glycerol-3-phosphate dehydrogenase
MNQVDQTIPDGETTSSEMLLERWEMAQKLSDVVLRRTELGAAGPPAVATLRRCAQVMAAELGWTQARIEREIDEVGV